MNTKKRLVMALASAGVPVDTVDVVGKSANVTYMKEATSQQVAKGEELLAAFDWSPEAESAWAESQQRADAKRMLTASDPMPLATRAACFGNMLSTQEARRKINEILAALQNGTIASVQPLATGDDLSAALVQVGQLIDAGVV
ncbi:MAG: hypothetical protein C0467_25360 [Planctomycetaceae bacterium]|nr:hypothetical protein [Planctomycetaceae bacterium]